jgi:hypothetical protein
VHVHLGLVGQIGASTSRTIIRRGGYTPEDFAIMIALGVSRQPMMFIAVDLPDPEGPMIATNSPAVNVRSTPSSAWTAASPVP